MEREARALRICQEARRRRGSQGADGEEKDGYGDGDGGGGGGEGAQRSAVEENAARLGTEGGFGNGKQNTKVTYAPYQEIWAFFCIKSGYKDEFKDDNITSWYVHV